MRREGAIAHQPLALGHDLRSIAVENVLVPQRTALGIFKEIEVEDLLLQHLAARGHDHVRLKRRKDDDVAAPQRIARALDDEVGVTGSDHGVDVVDILPLARAGEILFDAHHAHERIDAIEVARVHVSTSSRDPTPIDAQSFHGYYSTAVQNWLYSVYPLFVDFYPFFHG